MVWNRREFSNWDTAANNRRDVVKVQDGLAEAQRKNDWAKKPRKKYQHGRSWRPIAPYRSTVDTSDGHCHQATHFHLVLRMTSGRHRCTMFVQIFSWLKIGFDLSDAFLDISFTAICPALACFTVRGITANHFLLLNSGALSECTVCGTPQSTKHFTVKSKTRGPLMPPLPLSAAGDTVVEEDMFGWCWGKLKALEQLEKLTIKTVNRQHKIVSLMLV